MFSLRLGILLTHLVSVIYGNTDKSCSSNFDKVGVRCLKLVTEKKTYSGAQENCQKLGSRLASPSYGKFFEQLIKWDKMASRSKRKVWIGLSKSPHYFWADGTKFNETLEYFQKNKIRGISSKSKDCVFAKVQNPKLRAVWCGKKFASVCEKPLEEVTWSDWSPCSLTCGGGHMTRIRICPQSADSDNCTGPEIESNVCNTEDCPSTEVTWSDWSTCSVTCGGGHMTRTRICPQSRVAGRCPGPDIESNDCNTEECPPEWTTWSQCSVTCGGGQRTRTRECPKCPGLERETIACYQAPCPVVVVTCNNCDIVDITCPASLVVKVNYAKYGLIHGAHNCPSGAAKECNVTKDVGEIISEKCDENTRCKFWTTTGLLGDPCLGKTKHFKMEYTCYKSLKLTENKPKENTTAKTCLSPYTCTTDNDRLCFKCNTGGSGRKCKLLKLDESSDKIQVDALKMYDDFTYSQEEDEDVSGYSCLTSVGRNEIEVGKKLTMAVDFWDLEKEHPASYLGQSPEMTVFAVYTPDAPEECIPPSWTSWSPFGPCSKDGCGCQKTRTRICSVEGACEDQGTHSVECTEAECSWRNWSPWGRCRMDGGRCQKTRTRICSVHGGCQGQSTESVKCNRKACKYQCRPTGDDIIVGNACSYNK